jgi:hypothetical protein
MPRAFGDVSDDERIRYGRVLEQLPYVDGIVGRAMNALGQMTCCSSCPASGWSR